MMQTPRRAIVIETCPNHLNPSSEQALGTDHAPTSHNVLVTNAWARISCAIIRILAREDLEINASDHQQVFMSCYAKYCAGWFQHPHFSTGPECIDREPKMYPRHFGVMFRYKELFDGLINSAMEHNLPFFKEPFT